MQASPALPVILLCKPLRLRDILVLPRLLSFCIATTLRMTERFAQEISAYMALNCLCDGPYTPACSPSIPSTFATASYRRFNPCYFCINISDAWNLPKRLLWHVFKDRTRVYRCSFDSSHDSKAFWRLNKIFVAFAYLVRVKVHLPVLVSPPKLCSRSAQNGDKNSMSSKFDASSLPWIPPSLNNH